MKFEYDFITTKYEKIRKIMLILTFRLFLVVIEFSNLIYNFLQLRFRIKNIKNDLNFYEIYSKFVFLIRL